MILRDFLYECREIINQYPNALDMEMFSFRGSSGTIDPISDPFLIRIDELNNNEEIDMEDVLPKNYSFDSVISVYTGN